MSIDRIEAFSDGVFAFVLTLLFFRLAPPQIAAHSTLGQYARAMAPMIPNLVTFTVTFGAICVHWVSHHYFFSNIRRATIGLVWLNNILLLWICLLPLTTEMLGDHPTDQFPILLYGVDSLLAAVTFFALRREASSKGLFQGEDVRALGPAHSVPAIVLYALSIALVFVNVYLSLACLFTGPLFYFVPNFVKGRNRSGTAARKD